jgi:hypothetical protein
MSEYTNIFHTLRSKLGIKDYERHLVLKYHSGIHRYIQIEMQSKSVYISWTSPHYAFLINMQSKSSRNSSSGVSGSSGFENMPQQKHGK